MKSAAHAILSGPGAGHRFSIDHRHGDGTGRLDRSGSTLNADDAQLNGMATRRVTVRQSAGAGTARRRRPAIYLGCNGLRAR